MPLKAMYQKLAQRYEIANRFGSIHDSHRCAINQIIQHHLGENPRYKVLDLGVCNGSFLEKLKPYMPLAEFTGIDISKEMLQCAEQTISLKTIEGTAARASQYLPLHSQDLVLAHFINAYISIHDLFNQASLLTSNNGYFSLITTTYDSFPIAQQQLATFIAQDSLISSIVGHYYKAMVRNSTVAANENELMRSFEKYQFQVIDHQRLHIPITLNTIDELTLFGIEGTWFLNTLPIRMLPKHFLIQRLKRLFNRIFTFPYQDTHIIDVVLAKKVI